MPPSFPSSLSPASGRWACQHSASPRDRLADASCWRRTSYAWRKHSTKGTLPRHSTGFRTLRYCRCSCKHLSSFSGEETKFSVQASKLKALAFESTSRLLASDGTILLRSQLQRGHIVNCGASGTLLNGSACYKALKYFSISRCRGRVRTLLSPQYLTSYLVSTQGPFCMYSNKYPFKEAIGLEYCN